MKCPKDHADMEHKVIDNVPLDVCPKCNGVWMDWGELRMMSSDLVTEYELMYRGQSKRRCPKCGKYMNAADLHSAIVEECKCGIFFDAGEAEKVIGSIGKELSLETPEKTIEVTQKQLTELIKKGNLVVDGVQISIRKDSK